MKKKTIEGMAYLTLPKLSRKRKVRYVGRTAIKKVGNERHFFLEVYKNEEAARDVPVVRIVVNKKDFGTFWPESGRWSRALLTSEYQSHLIWQTEEGHASAEENVLYGPEDLERVKRFFKDVSVRKDEKWWEYVNGGQDRICCEERAARRWKELERRAAALEDRARHTPQLEEQKLLEHADQSIFWKKHFLYYKKRGRRAEVCCSACGGVASGAFKAGEGYEGNFEKHVEEPKEGKVGTCPLCHEPGVYKCQGRARAQCREEKHVFLVDKYKKSGVVIRYVKLGKEWRLDEACGEKGPEMLGAYEQLDGVEVARTYVHPEEGVQTDYHKHDWCRGKDFWDDCNLYGNGYVHVGPAGVYPESWKNLEGTCLQYSQAREFLEEVGSNEVSLKEYVERYLAMPQIEFLVKMKLFGVVLELVKYGNWNWNEIVEDGSAKSPDAFLGIKKDKVKFLAEHKGDVEVLRILKIEKRLDGDWTGEQVVKLVEIRAEQRKLELALRFTSLQKVLNAIGRYAGCEYGTGCPHAVERLRHTATTYFDYFAMRAQRGYDLTNTVYQRPRDLELEHDKLAAELDLDLQDKRIKEVEERFPLIREGYGKLRARYLYEDEVFTIRPAKSAAEIVLEGRTLHHCVGSDAYLQKHNDGKGTILLLRFKERQEVPYVTVEVEGERIVQWYGAHDKKPDKENLQAWLDAYVTRLKCTRLGVAEGSEQDFMQRMLTTA